MLCFTFVKCISDELSTSPIKEFFLKTFFRHVHVTHAFPLVFDKKLQPRQSLTRPVINFKSSREVLNNIGRVVKTLEEELTT